MIRRQNEQKQLGLTSEELGPQQSLSCPVRDGPHVCGRLLGIHILWTQKGEHLQSER